MIKQSQLIIKLTLSIYKPLHQNYILKSIIDK